MDAALAPSFDLSPSGCRNATGSRLIPAGVEEEVIFFNYRPKGNKEHIGHGILIILIKSV